MEINVEINEIDNVCREYAGFHRLVNTKLSTLFKIQYFLMYKDGGFDLLSINNMVMNIDRGKKIEGTKNTNQFGHEPLNRFYHQHIFDLKHLPGNIVNEIRFKESKILPELKALCERYIGKSVDEKFINEASSILVIETMNNRIKGNRFTGEWMIYAKKNEMNYMLCFSEHTKGDGDIMLYNAIKKYCYNEFPFLFEKL